MLEHGIHARPAATLAAVAKKLTADINIVFGDRKANAKSPVALMSLGVRKGDEIVIQASGVDAESAAATVERAIAGGKDSHADAATLAVTGGAASAASARRQTPPPRRDVRLKVRRHASLAPRRPPRAQRAPPRRGRCRAQRGRRAVRCPRAPRADLPLPQRARLCPGLYLPTRQLAAPPADRHRVAARMRRPTALSRASWLAEAWVSALPTNSPAPS